jgi:hypothetical protein
LISDIHRLLEVQREQIDQTELFDTRRRSKIRQSHEVSYVIACFMLAGCFRERRFEVPDGGRLACRCHEASVAASPLQSSMNLTNCKIYRSIDISMAKE